MNESGIFRVLGGRTFALTVGCGLACSVLLWFGKLDSGGFVAVIIGTVGAYITANAFTKHAEVRADVQKTIAQAQVEAAPPTVVEQVPR